MSEPRTVICRVRLSPAERDAIDEAAAAASMSFSAYVRDALDLRMLEDDEFELVPVPRFSWRPRWRDRHR